MLTSGAAEAMLDLAARLQGELDLAGFGVTIESIGPVAATLPPDRIDVFDTMVTEPGLRATVLRLYRDGHYAQAVEEAYKYINNLVKQRAGSGADGSALMKAVFSPNNPTLRLNSLRSQSQKDQQLGYMEILS